MHEDAVVLHVVVPGGSFYSFWHYDSETSYTEEFGGSYSIRALATKEPYIPLSVQATKQFTGVCCFVDVGRIFYLVRLAPLTAPSAVPRLINGVHPPSMWP